mgnify:CR=1 FL=1
MDITQARARLERERDRLVALRQSQGEDAALDQEQADSSGSLADYDQHPGDQGTETFERTKDLAVREQIDARLADIDAALDKIEAGTYGQCEICGRVIDPARLEARPSVRYCYEHQQQSDDAAEQGRLFGPD